MRWHGEPRKRVNKTWRSWFAWRPVKTMDGIWIWLEPVEFNDYMAHDVPSTATFSWSFYVYRPHHLTGARK